MQQLVRHCSTRPTNLLSWFVFSVFFLKIKTFTAIYIHNMQRKHNWKLSLQNRKTQVETHLWLKKGRSGQSRLVPLLSTLKKREQVEMNSGWWRGRDLLFPHATFVHVKQRATYYTQISELGMPASSAAWCDALATVSFFGGKEGSRKKVDALPGGKVDRSNAIGM